MSYYRYCATYTMDLYPLIALIISYGAERFLNNRTSAKKSLVPGRNEALAIMRLVLRLTRRRIPRRSRYGRIPPSGTVRTMTRWRSAFRSTE